MSYFSFLPNAQYRISDSSHRIVAKNILVRAKIFEGIRNFISASAEYTIRDGEKPEHIAHRVYGRADYHWIILMFNEIHDPYFGWPMTANELSAHMEKAYPGKSLFINTGGVIESGKLAIMNETLGIPLDRKHPHFEIGSTIEQYNPSGLRIASATITGWNPDLWKIDVENVNGVFRLQGAAAAVDIATGNLNPVSDPLSLPRDIKCKNSNGHVVSASLLRIVEDNRFAINRFVDEDEQETNPWYVPDGSASPLIERYVNGRQEIIDTEEGTYSILTNLAYEEANNDTKRNIKVMRPEYIDPLLKEMSRVMGG